MKTDIMNVVYWQNIHFAARSNIVMHIVLFVIADRDFPLFRRKL